MKTLFISDLHLSAQRPEITGRFLRFLAAEACSAEVLYILGDLFDVWVGDDDIAEPIPQVVEGLRALADTGTSVRLMRGNRDFLIGERFAAVTGAELLDDPALIELDGIRTLLMHGDLLCTDDLAYQQARGHLRDPRTIAGFLAQPLEARRRQAAEYRRQSGEAISLKAAEIMDVNRATVGEYLDRYDARRLIHGHTHRPGRHRVAWARGTATRHVLPQWSDEGGGYLEAADGRLTARELD